MEYNLDNSTIVFGAITIPVVTDSRNKQWFKANPVAAALKYARPGKAIIDHVKLGHKKSLACLGLATNQSYNDNKEMYINEFGLY